jgi:hypothetical protein
MSERNQNRLLRGLLSGLVGAMGVFLIGLILGISSGEDGKSRAAVGMCSGAAGALLVCGALILVSFVIGARKQRSAARQLPEHLRVPVLPVIGRSPAHPAGGNGEPLVQTDADEIVREVLLETNREAEFEFSVDYEAPGPAPAFRALGIRLDNESAGSSPTRGYQDNGSHHESLRRVEGTVCKGRLCWICGEEHGPEIVHETKSADSGSLAYDAVPAEWLLTAYDDYEWD